MTISMTAKNQITIPKRITQTLGLAKGSLFNVEIAHNRIELIPLEVSEKVFTEKEYRKIDDLCAKEKNRRIKATGKLITGLKLGKI
jgi:AbrB family looped-hinge helix DNA binding protein